MPPSPARVGAAAGPGPAARRWLIAELLQAQSALRNGRPADAEQACRRALRIVPDHADALNLASIALGRLGRHGDGEKASRRAVALCPEQPDYLINLAERLRLQSRFEEAIEGHRLALGMAPDRLLALDGLARALAESGCPEAALEPATRASQLAPEVGGSHALQGEILALLRRDDEAIEALATAVELTPAREDWWRNLARLSLATGDLVRLEQSARHLLGVAADDPEAKVHLANALYRKDAFGEVRRLLESVPVEGLNGANAQNLLGVTLARQGRLEAGLEAIERVPALAPEAFELLQNRLLHLNYASDRTPAELKGEHLAWADRFASPVIRAASPGHDRDPDRRLRIGYLSPDLRRHSVAYFTAPLLAGRDPDQVETVCYASVARPDHVTADLQRRADLWRDVRQLDDRALADQIRADRIDILVELAGHTRDSRILACAQRPAPIQINYLGYPNTTGVGAIDYRITDHLADPEGFDDHYSETLIRLRRCFLAYAPPENTPEVGPPPVLANGHVTFGSFNNLAKINRDVVALWAQILGEVEGARLVLKSAGTRDPETSEVLHAAFAAHGIAPARVEVLPPEPSPKDHLRAYEKVDIALDPFPYNGTTTTCEALWMGVPVITLAGDRHASRVGASLLSTVGFTAGVASTAADYVLTARLLAGRPELLSVARQSLRTDLKRSPLCDHVDHARALEEAYRAVWHIWCAAA